MFVRSRLSKDIVYRKRGKDWVIKAGTITFIDENQVSAQELRKLYSTRIEIMSRERQEAMEEEIPIAKVTKEPEKKEVIKKPLDEKILDDILTEIKDEIPAKKEVKPNELSFEIVDPIKEAFMTEVGSEVVPQKQEENKLKVTKDEIGDLVLEPVHAGADLKIELDAVQPVEIKKEEPPEETGKEIPVLDEKEEIEKPKKVSKASSKKPNGKRRGRTKKPNGKRRGRTKKATAK